VTTHKGTSAWGTAPDLDCLPVLLRDYRGFDFTGRRRAGRVRRRTGRTQALSQSRSEQGGAP